MRDANLRSETHGIIAFRNAVTVHDVFRVVTRGQFAREFGRIQISDKAEGEPVTITREGRDELVLLSAAEYDRLKRRDRRVVRLDDFTDEEMALIEQAEVPAEYARPDAELTARA
jgi:PHD/YefM family antitoxin component YafN of YafNO toxin-antitoxin module